MLDVPWVSTDAVSRRSLVCCRVILGETEANRTLGSASVDDCLQMSDDEQPACLCAGYAWTANCWAVGKVRDVEML